MSRTIGTYLVDLLLVNDVDTVFGIPGVHNLELYRGLAGAHCRHLLMRHEQGAGFAADGYARMAGRTAAAFVISGPGLTNVLTAAAQAYSDSVPLLVVASAPVRASQGQQWGVLHELKNHAALAAEVFGVSCTARSAEDVREQLKLCLTSLRAPRPRPAYLEIPLDLLNEHTSLEPARFAAAPSSPLPDSTSIDAAVRSLAAASRPLLIAGGGACHARDAVRRLAERLVCPVLTTTAGKGIVPHDHPAHFGAALAFAPTRELVAAADVVLAVGTELAETDIFHAMQLEIGGTLIRIDVDPAKLHDHNQAQIKILADAAEALTRIEAGLAATAPAAPAARESAAAFRARIDASFDAQAHAQRAALLAIRRALPADAAIFTDMTQIAYLGNYAFPVDAVGCWFHPSGYGTLGYALPAAIGAKFSSPSRTVLALAGDFGVQFTLNEFMTAVEAQLSLPLVIWNNGALGQIRDDMLASGIPPTDVVARNPDFVALALACGGHGIRVTDPDSLTAALRTALQTVGPTLVEIDAGRFV